MIRADTERCRDLDALMARMIEGDDDYRYSVAWIDCLATGASLGRSVLSRGDHATLDELPQKRATAVGLRAPRCRRATVGAERAAQPAQHRRASTSSGSGHAAVARQVETIASFFHPLDGVRGWNRLYGSRGFLQYQYVVPDDAHDAVRIDRDAQRGARGVVPGGAEALRPGQPRAAVVPGAGLDARARHPGIVPGLAELLDHLDELVVDVGGRIYLAKDSRLRPELLPVMYPELDRFAELRARVDPAGVLQSDLQRRLGLP